MALVSNPLCHENSGCTSLVDAYMEGSQDDVKGDAPLILCEKGKIIPVGLYVLLMSRNLFSSEQYLRVKRVEH